MALDLKAPGGASIFGLTPVYNATHMVSYVVSRDKLIELSVSLGLLSEPSKRAVLEALPSTIREYALKQVRP